MDDRGHPFINFSSEHHSAYPAVANFAAEKIEGTVSLDDVKKHVEICLKQHNDTYILAKFDKHAVKNVDRLGTENRGISMDKFLEAVEEFGGEKSEDVFTAMDVHSNGYLGVEEFKIAVQNLRAARQIEQWVSHLPLKHVLASALSPVVAAYTSSEKMDPLFALSVCPDNALQVALHGFLHGIQSILLTRVLGLRKSYAAKGGGQKDLKESHQDSKFAVNRMSCGDISSFFEGLGERVGFPNLKFMEGMENEHCNQANSEEEFTTSNYQFRTTPKQEWLTVKNVDKSKEIDQRVIPDYMELCKSDASRKAHLRECEIVAVVLYTGPMFQIYNMVLRQWPHDKFLALKENLYSTTIHCLVSAVTKISRETKISDGLIFYRGLGGVQLPESFYKRGKTGFKCFVEWGFMSTTSNKNVAVQYTGIANGQCFPTLLQVRSAAVDHGADIGAFSQYPGEREYLWNPLSLVEPNGEPFIEDAPGGLVTIIPVRMNMNVKSMTVDELEGQKKAMHLSSFKFSIEELSMKLKSKSSEIIERMQTDCEVEDAKQTCKEFQKAILRQCQEVYDLHDKKTNDEYINAEIFRSLVIGMLDCSMFASSKVLSYLNDPASKFSGIQKSQLRSAHRRYVSFLERRYHDKVSREGTEEVQSDAWQLCKIKGLLTSDLRPDPENGSSKTSLPKGSNALEVVFDGDVKEPRIVSAAQEDLSSNSLRLLVAARANINAVDSLGNTAIMKAAYVGNAPALKTLQELGGVPSKVLKDGYSAMHVAAQEGHAACIHELSLMGLDPEMATNTGFTPLMAAAAYGHARCVDELAKLISLKPGVNFKNNINAEDEDKMTALLYAAKYNDVECIKKLSLFDATVDFRALIIARHFRTSGSDDKCYDCIKVLAQLAWDPKVGEKVQVLIDKSPYSGVVAAKDETMSPFYVKFDEGVESDGWFKRQEIIRCSNTETSFEKRSKIMLSADYCDKRDTFLTDLGENHTSLRGKSGEVVDIYQSKSNFLVLYRIRFSNEKYQSWYTVDELQAA